MKNYKIQKVMKMKLNKKNINNKLLIPNYINFFFDK